jgi:Fe-S cluster assembly protein SufD
MPAAAPPARTWLDLKQHAIKRAEQIGLPTTQLEDWRYVNVACMSKPPTADPVSVVKSSVAPHLLTGMAATLVLVNGSYRADLSHEPAAKGITCEDLFELSEPEARVLQQRWKECVATSDDIGTCWSLCDLAGGLRIRAHGLNEGTLHIVSVSAGGCHGSRLVIEIAAGGNLDLAISHIELTPSRSSIAMEVDIGAGGNLRVDEIQHGATGQLYATAWPWLARDANVSWTTLSTGGDLVRFRSKASLKDAGAQYSANGLTVVDGRRQAHRNIRVQHQIGHTKSSQLFKTIAAGQAQASFDGLVTIAAGADESDAEQRNNNLLLSPKARVSTRPQLDILDDAVKASHGATIGQLDDDELFYLRSRGLSAVEARGLLTRGFADEVISLLHNSHARALARYAFLAPLSDVS